LKSILSIFGLFCQAKKEIAILNAHPPYRWVGKTYFVSRFKIKL